MAKHDDMNLFSDTFYEAQIGLGWHSGLLVSSIPLHRMAGYLRDAVFVYVGPSFAAAVFASRQSATAFQSLAKDGMIQRQRSWTAGELMRQRPWIPVDPHLNWDLSYGDLAR